MPDREFWLSIGQQNAFSLPLPSNILRVFRAGRRCTGGYAGTRLQSISGILYQMKGGKLFVVRSTMVGE